MARTQRVTDKMRKHEQWLTKVTALPTAAGREQRIIDWVEAWVRRRKGVKLQRDRWGNLLLKRESVTQRSPIVLEAHMDHPAFVVTETSEEGKIVAQFRGGVAESYFQGAPVWLHRKNGERVAGKVVAYKAGPTNGDTLPANRAEIALEEAATVEVGEVITWRTDGPHVDRRADRFISPVCDNLASVVAALCAFDELRDVRTDVRLLLSRAEEVGFIGAIAAARSGSIPKRSRVIVLENSKSFAESPIGGGPIVRVGDRTSTFDPDLTYRIGRVAAMVEEAEAGFVWQRKLMPGGTCNASAYQAHGFAASCVCLPLGNYHNMNEESGAIDAETISVQDFHRLVTLLKAIGRHLDDEETAPALKTRLGRLFEARQHLLSE